MFPFEWGLGCAQNRFQGLEKSLVFRLQANIDADVVGKPIGLHGSHDHPLAQHLLENHGRRLGDIDQEEIGFTPVVGQSQGIEPS